MNTEKSTSVTEAEEHPTEMEEKKEMKKKKKPSIKEQMASLQEELDAMKDKYLRNVAEFENFRRRSIQEKSQWIKGATQRLVLELCDVNDNFERALNLEEAHKADGSFEEGIRMIFQQLTSILDKEGVKKIEALEQDFDPNIHEALAQIPSELEENKVAAVIQNGYTMHDVVIRPARVAVSSGQKPVTETKEENK
ncbi:MAG: nucleotide exchange factor GrpE [Candidatus Cloacimonetes bacterium]|nr:nucleotide exchange factor GrpE [Candidatus Cloacimonadota bacterium]